MSTLEEELAGTLAGLRESGLYKDEWEIETPQSAHVQVGGRDVLNLCANNYLGLASHPSVIAAAHEALDRWGFGMASVRFICGTQEIHKQLERSIADRLRAPDQILAHLGDLARREGGLRQDALEDRPGLAEIR